MEGHQIISAAPGKMARSHLHQAFFFQTLSDIRAVIHKGNFRNISFFGNGERNIKCEYVVMSFHTGKEHELC